MNRIWHWTEIGMDSIFIENWQRNRDGILYPAVHCFLKSVMIRGKLFHSCLIRQDLKIYT